MAESEKTAAYSLPISPQKPSASPATRGPRATQAASITPSKPRVTQPSYGERELGSGTPRGVSLYQDDPHIQWGSNQMWRRPTPAMQSLLQDERFHRSMLEASQRDAVTVLHQSLQRKLAPLEECCGRGEAFTMLVQIQEMESEIIQAEEETHWQNLLIERAAMQRVLALEKVQSEEKVARSAMISQSIIQREMWKVEKASLAVLEEEVWLPQAQSWECLESTTRLCAEVQVHEERLLHSSFYVLSLMDVVMECLEVEWVPARLQEHLQVLFQARAAMDICVKETLAREAIEKDYFLEAGFVQLYLSSSLHSSSFEEFRSSFALVEKAYQHRTVVSSEEEVERLLLKSDFQRGILKIRERNEKYGLAVASFVACYKVSVGVLWTQYLEETKATSVWLRFCVTACEIHDHEVQNRKCIDEEQCSEFSKLLNCYLKLFLARYEETRRNLLYDLQASYFNSARQLRKYTMHLLVPHHIEQLIRDLHLLEVSESRDRLRITGESLQQSPARKPLVRTEMEMLKIVAEVRQLEIHEWECIPLLEQEGKLRVEIEAEAALFYRSMKVIHEHSSPELMRSIVEFADWESLAIFYL